MAQIPDLKTVMINAHANSHRQIFNAFARSLSPVMVYDYYDLLDKIEHLQDNETAAIGGGVMIFHGWVDNWPESTLSFMQLRKPFEALNTPDRQPIDLVLLLLSPKSDGPLHLGRLSGLTRAMRDTALCDTLRGATSTDAVHAIFDRLNRQNAKAA